MNTLIIGCREEAHLIYYIKLFSECMIYIKHYINFKVYTSSTKDKIHALSQFEYQQKSPVCILLY